MGGFRIGFLLLGGGFLLGFLALLAAQLAQVFDGLGHLRIVETGDFDERRLITVPICRKEKSISGGD
jgi:hypothetical protein